MGIYSRHIEQEYDVQANESYVGTLGCYNALIDMERNNRAIFEHNIARDFQEAVMVNEGASEEELLAFTEASLGGFFEAFKSMVKKIWEKIKGVFSTFLKKLDTVIIRDNKKFVDKYQRQVRTKNLSKLKYKYCKQLDGFGDIKDSLTTKDKFKAEADNVMKGFANWFGSLTFYKDMLEKDDLIPYFIEKCISGKLKNVEMKDLSKEVHDICFDSEESEEGLDSSRLTDIIIILQGDKTKKDIETAQKSVDKHFRSVLKELDRYSKDLSKSKIDDNNKKIEIDRPDDSSKQVPIKNNKTITNYLQNAGVIQTVINNLENVHNRAVACFLNENKFRISQARKVFAKAVSYNDKAKNESVYLDAVEEAAEYEINEMFEQYCL